MEEDARIGNLIYGPMLGAAETEQKKAETCVSANLKEWRLPTLAESIKPLPSATLRLTAVFGMGTGRTTALRPPKIVKEQAHR